VKRTRAQREKDRFEARARMQDFEKRMGQEYAASLPDVLKKKI